MPDAASSRSATRVRKSERKVSENGITPGVAGTDDFRLQTEEHAEALTDVDEDIGRRLLFEHHLPGRPIEILDVVSEDNPGDLPAGRQRYFERVSFDMTRNRARYSETGL